MLAPILITSLFTTSAFAASASQWANRTIYQLVTDRFALANDSGSACDTSARNYCGGSWQGVIHHLDYIQNMGFDAVWISPVASNFEGTSAYGEAFHGYWPTDLTTVNQHFGQPSDLQALATALHSRGMYLMLDVVVNHLASTTATPDYADDFKPFNTATDFHAPCWITDYSNQTNVEQCWLGDTNVALADIDTEDQAVVTQLYDYIQNLVKNYGADGVRIDTVKHVRKDFWPGWASAAGVFTMGEVLNNDTSYISAYTQVLDTVLDYGTWFPLVAAFQTPFGNLSALQATVQTIQSTFKNGAFGIGSFLENHDQPRFPSLCNDTSLIANAVTWPFINDGIPILYYGQEQGYAGGSDPANREALWLSGYSTDKPLVNQVTALNHARKAAIAANPSFTTTKAAFPATGKNSMAISKPPMLALLTNEGASGTGASWSVPASGTGYSASETLVDVLTCNKITTDSSGAVTASSVGGMPMVLIPASALSTKGSLCASVATNTSAPAASSTGKSGAASVRVAGGSLGALVLGMVGVMVALV